MLMPFDGSTVVLAAVPLLALSLLVAAAMLLTASTIEQELLNDANSGAVLIPQGGHRRAETISDLLSILLSA